MLSLPPLALYVHLPWCERKCPYCDFNSHAAGTDAPFAAYCDRLLEDLQQDIEWVQGRPVDSIFMGGGTPSLFPADQVARLLQGIRERLTLATDAEVTLEANPGSSDARKFAAFRDAGINRLSIGVQSFDDRCLRALGRVHDAGQAHAAIEAAQSAGFTRLNVDLMHGLPGQNAAAAVNDLEQALAHGVPHLSWYQLTIEANTQFHNSPPVLPREEELAQIQERGEAVIAARGLLQYEVSAFALPGRQCAHNLNYWNFGDYIGIGAGAHGKISLPESNRVLRTRRTRAPRDYLEGAIARLRHTSEVIEAELPLEYLMNALRLREGTTWSQFVSRVGHVAESVKPALRISREQGLLDADPSWIRASETGYRHLDAVLARLA